ncbi:MAG: tRNA uridine-5-carboxymethylaminomethyl(34) synthesis enzyme MnmG [Pyrinomonadaceae bacterium]|nr:tRNA uridine-5-carboxymethylaminomethyl(34) synthesis enzyme MnmG [Phycisphaerales bacterium]
MQRHYAVIVIGGGHAGAEAAWAAANLLACSPGNGANGESPRPTVAFVTLDPSKIGVMSCNPAIGGLAKGQIVREIDAMGGLMGLATDATGIQFKILNSSKGAAVQGPRAQCDKHAYARAVQRMIASRPEIEVVAGAVERLLVEEGRVAGVEVRMSQEAVSRGRAALNGVEDEPRSAGTAGRFVTLLASAVVLTRGTFMRGRMHTGEPKTAGGRFGEAPAEGISGALRDLGFELGRLKTGTPPRLRRGTIDWERLEKQFGDERPVPFSDLSGVRPGLLGSEERSEGEENLVSGALGTADSFGPSGRGGVSEHLPRVALEGSLHPWLPAAPAEAKAGSSNTSDEPVRFDAPEMDVAPSLWKFPVLTQVACRVTATNAAIHSHIRANIHRAPMYSGQIESSGPRYCPSIEDKVVRFAERESHHVFLEPESHDDDWIYCNGVSTSLPADVQDVIVRLMPGCEQAEILRYGYAVEYDMVRPHQITAGGMTKLVWGLFLAGQINGTSGYEEAAGQGLIAGINAARIATGREPITLGREQAYIGVMMDDLVTKTPVEPYRMFTSRAEHRLLLRSDNAADRLTPLAIELGLLESTALGRLRQQVFAERRRMMAAYDKAIDRARVQGVPLSDLIRRPEFTLDELSRALAEAEKKPGAESDDGMQPSPSTMKATREAALFTVYTNRVYAAYIIRQNAEIKRQAEMERRHLPTDIDYRVFPDLRTEAREALARFRPETYGQAGRLEGITPADLTLLAVLVRRHTSVAG